MQNDILKGLENLTNNEKVKENMMFFSIYLMLFENFKEYCVSNLKSFFQEVRIIDGKAQITTSDEYKKLENKKFNGKKNIFLATLNWFVDIGAISREDFEKILCIRDDRNRISHELLELLYDDCNENMVKNFLECIEIYKKVDRWWILNIEIPISGEYNLDDISEEGVISGNFLMISIVLDNIYGMNSYKEVIDDLKINKS